MRRREFLAGLATTLATPLVAEAQPVGKVYRIGYLSPQCPIPSHFMAPFSLGLRELG